MADDLRDGGTFRELRTGASQVPADERADQLGAVPDTGDLAEVVPVVVIDAYDPVGGVGVLRSADHAASVSRAYAESLAKPLAMHMRRG
jgi:hypothetical protein